MKPNDLLQKRATKNRPLVLDVRSGMEFNSGHIPGAIHAPNLKILLKMAKLPEDKNSELVVTCEHGPRAQRAQGLLSMYGYNNTKLLQGHMSGWRRAGLKIEK